MGGTSTNLAHILREFYKVVALQLHVDHSDVSSVALGERRSKRIEAAMLRELKRIKNFIESNGGRPGQRKVRLASSQITLKQFHSIDCPVCLAGPGKRCRLQAGGLRNDPHWLRKHMAITHDGKRRTRLPTSRK